MAILDGEYIDDKDIDPARHKFIGTFREPFSTYESVSLVFFHCGCGENLFNQQAVFDHWQRGHMDAPQYVTMGRDAAKAHSGEWENSPHRCYWGQGMCREIGGCFWLAIFTPHPKTGINIPVNYCPYCGAKAPNQVDE